MHIFLAGLAVKILLACKVKFFCFFFFFFFLRNFASQLQQKLEQVWNVYMWRCSSFFFTFWIHQWTDFFQVRGKFSVAWQIGGVLIFNPSVDCVCFFASPQVFLIHQWTVTITFPQRCMKFQSIRALIFFKAVVNSQWHVLTEVKILVQYWFSIHQWTVRVSVCQIRGNFFINGLWLSYIQSISGLIGVDVQWRRF